MLQVQGPSYLRIYSRGVASRLLLTQVAENAELREQLATSQNLLMETAIDAGNMHALVEAVRVERDADAWKQEAEQLRTGSARFHLNPMGAG